MMSNSGVKLSLSCRIGRIRTVSCSWWLGGATHTASDLQANGCGFDCFRGPDVTWSGLRNIASLKKNRKYESSSSGGVGGGGGIFEVND